MTGVRVESALGRGKEVHRSVEKRDLQRERRNQGWSSSAVVIIYTCCARVYTRAGGWLGGSVLAAVKQDVSTLMAHRVRRACTASFSRDYRTVPVSVCV